MRHFLAQMNIHLVTVQPPTRTWRSASCQPLGCRVLIQARPLISNYRELGPGTVLPCETTKQLEDKKKTHKIKMDYLLPGSIIFLVPVTEASLELSRFVPCSCKPGNAAFCHPRSPASPRFPGVVRPPKSHQSRKGSTNDGLAMIQDWRACMCHSCSWIFFPPVYLFWLYFPSISSERPHLHVYLLILRPTSAAATDERVRLMR